MGVNVLLPYSEQGTASGLCISKSFPESLRFPSAHASLYFTVSDNTYEEVQKVWMWIQIFMQSSEIQYFLIMLFIE